jgi:hypothetical protein
MVDPVQQVLVAPHPGVEFGDPRADLGQPGLQHVDLVDRRHLLQPLVGDGVGLVMPVQPALHGRTSRDCIAWWRVRTQAMVIAAIDSTRLEIRIAKSTISLIGAGPASGR